MKKEKGMSFEFKEELSSSPTTSPSQNLTQKQNQKP